MFVCCAAVGNSFNVNVSYLYLLVHTYVIGLGF